MMINVYAGQPTLVSGAVTLRPITEDDLGGLLRCYSDPAAVPLFNGDNCHGDDFHYTTAERMKQAMDFWAYAYEHGCFVRWAIQVGFEAVGTVEMLRRAGDDADDGKGILRIDLASAFERTEVLDSVLDCVCRDFYRLFGVDDILTKSPPQGITRREALLRSGFEELGRLFLIFPDYMTRKARDGER